MYVVARRELLLHGYRASKFATGICFPSRRCLRYNSWVYSRKATSFTSLPALYLSEGIRGSTVNKNIFSPFFTLTSVASFRQHFLFPGIWPGVSVYVEKDPVNTVFRVLGFIRASEGIQFLSITISNKSMHSFRSVTAGFTVIPD